MRAALLSMVAMAAAGLVMAASQGGPSYFLGLGRTSDNLEEAQDVFGPDVVVPFRIGHDGERFWALARDPLLLEGDDLADRLDRPAYRAQRIGYPMLAAPWRLAGERPLLWGLFVTNLLVVGAGTVATGSLAVTRGARPSPVAYAFVANPLVWLSVMFDLGDGLALLGLLAALLAVARHRVGWTGAASVLAALAKETSLLGLAGAAVLSRGLDRKTRLALVVPGAVAAALWRLYVVTRPGFGATTLKELRVIPFSGYVSVWRQGFASATDWAYLVVTLGLLALAGWCVALWWRDRGDLLLCAALPYALLMPFLAPVVYVPINSVRVVGPALTLAAVYHAGIRGRRAGDERAETTGGRIGERGAG